MDFIIERLYTNHIQPMGIFKQKNDIDIKATAFSFNVSMDDFYVITSISRKIVEEGLELAKIWSDYAVNEVVSDEFNDFLYSHAHIQRICSYHLNFLSQSSQKLDRFSINIFSRILELKMMFLKVVVLI